MEEEKITNKTINFDSVKNSNLNFETNEKLFFIDV